MDTALGSEAVPQEREEEADEGEREEVPRINVEIPRCVAQLGSDLHFVKLPNFLSVETRCVLVHYGHHSWSQLL